MKNLKKIILIFGFILLPILFGKSFAIDLEFDDNMLSCFPCAEYAHYDVWFNITGNDFDGVIIWSGARDLVEETGTGVLLEFGDVPGDRCPLLDCANDKIVCKKQIMGLYFDKVRGQRIFPMDPESHSLLKKPSCGGNGYDELIMTGGWYTDCTGVDTKYTINPYGIYGEIRHTRPSISGEVFHLYAGLDYNFDNNQLAKEHYYFVNNLQFIPKLNKFLDEQYWYYSGGLQGILFDNYGGVGFIGDRICVFPGDGKVVAQGEFVTGYHHNDIVGEEPTLDYEVLQCVNGTLEGRTGYDYSTPLDCKTEDGIIIPHNTGKRMWKEDIFLYKDRKYVNEVGEQVNFGRTGAEYKKCWDGYIIGSSEYKYANPQILSPNNCYFPQTNKLIEHLGNWTGYKFLSTDYKTSGNCEYGAVFSCFNGNISVEKSTWIKHPSDSSLGFQPGSKERTGQLIKYNNAIKDIKKERTGYKYDSCTFLQPKQCIIPRGGKLNDGKFVTAYKNLKEINGQSSCKYEKRQCVDGTLSGSFEYESCQLVNLDKTPDVIKFSPQEDLELLTTVVSNEQIVWGLDKDVKVDISLSDTQSGILIINGTEVKNNSTVKNGDKIKIKLTSSNEYGKTNMATVNLAGVKSFFIIKTKLNTSKTFKDKYPVTKYLNNSQKRLIFRKYMKLLDGYSSKAYNMCFVTDSLTKIIGNKLFEVNKNIITTSSMEIKKVERMKKQILEYLIEITNGYRDTLVRKIIINSAGKKQEIETIGCKNE